VPSALGQHDGHVSRRRGRRQRQKLVRLEQRHEESARLARRERRGKGQREPPIVQGRDRGRDVAGLSEPGIEQQIDRRTPGGTQPRLPPPVGRHSTEEKITREAGEEFGGVEEHDGFR
jgi:hypothetical protein